MSTILNYPIKSSTISSPIHILHIRYYIPYLAYTVLCSHVLLNVNTFVYFASNSGTFFASMEMKYVFNCISNGLKKRYLKSPKFNLQKPCV